jgi:hypothetical protein
MIGVAVSVTGWFASASMLGMASQLVLALAALVVTMLVAVTR